MTPPLEAPAENATGADYLAAVAALAPAIAAASAEIERNQRLPASLVAALHQRGLWRMLLPRPFGGAEIDPVSFVQVIEAIAKIDASTAWIMCQTSVTAMTAARLEPEAAWQIWRDPDAVLAWGPSNDARAVACDGGYRVSGNWAFASGCWYATWLGGDCPVIEADGTPRRDEHGAPVVRRMLFPRDKAAMKEIWNVIGLRGTGSDGYGVKDLFVPQSLTVDRNDLLTERRYHGRLYEMSPYSMFACGFAMLALGIARSLHDSFIELANAKTPRGYKNALRNDGMVQGEVGQAEAQLRSARMYVLGTLGQAWDATARQGEVGVEHRVAMRLAGTYAIHQAKTAAEHAYDAAGATAIFAGNAFERRYRDLRTVTQQMQGRRAHFQTVGQYLMGVESDLGWI